MGVFLRDYGNMNGSWQTLFFVLYSYNYMYFTAIAIARLSHKPSWAGCIPAGNIEIYLLIYMTLHRYQSSASTPHSHVHSAVHF